jgi:hypothetical protein
LIDPDHRGFSLHLAGRHDGTIASRPHFPIDPSMTSQSTPATESKIGTGDIEQLLALGLVKPIELSRRA